MRMAAGSLFAWLCLATAGFVARAEERPDTSTIKELSVEEARRLVEEVRLTVEEARRLGRYARHGLALDGLTTLSDDVARELAALEESELSLKGLKTLSAGAAEALGGHSGTLYLNGLTTLSPQAAAAFGNHRGFLCLDGIATLSDEAAKPLLKTGGSKDREMSRGILSMNGLTTLSPAAAEALAGRTKGDILIEGLTTLTPEVATNLAKLPKNRWIGRLPRIRTVSTEVAQALALRQGGLSLPGLEELSPTTAAALVGKFDGQLPNLGALTPELATVLAEFKGQELTLNGLTTLDAKTAGAIAAFNGRQLSLNGLTTVDAGTARALAAYKGERLFLSGLTAVDADTATALAEFKGRELFLNGLKRLDPETAGPLAAFRGRLLQLDGLPAIDADTFLALAAFKGILSLDGLARVDAAAAELVAVMSRAGTVRLAMPRLINSIGGEIPLTLATARLAMSVAVSNSESNGPGTLALHGVTAFAAPDSVAIAQALAMWKGPLALPNLKKISPKTLSALIEKEDISIPLIETLELIPEPDGSPTDDFVIPARVEKRQAKEGAGQDR